MTTKTMREEILRILKENQPWIECEWCLPPDAEAVMDEDAITDRLLELVSINKERMAGILFAELGNLKVFNTLTETKIVAKSLAAKLSDERGEG